MATQHNTDLVWMLETRQLFSSCWCVCAQALTQTHFVRIESSQHIISDMHSIFVCDFVWIWFSLPWFKQTTPKTSPEFQCSFCCSGALVSFTGLNTITGHLRLVDPALRRGHITAWWYVWFCSLSPHCNRLHTKYRRAERGYYSAGLRWLLNYCVCTVCVCVVGAGGRAQVCVPPQHTHTHTYTYTHTHTHSL